MNDSADRSASDAGPPGFSTEEDELVSAVLDDEATDTERQSVLGDPRLRARLEQFEAVAVLVAAAPPEATSAQRESSVTGAMGAAGPTRLETYRRPALRRAAPWLVAAAVLLMLLPFGVFAMRSGSDPQEFADVGRAIDEEAPSGAGRGEEDSDRGASAPSTTVSPQAAAPEAAGPSAGDSAAEATVDFGAVSSEVELAEAVRSTLSTDLDTTSQQTTTLGVPGPAGPCEEALRARDPGLGTVLAAGTLSYQGRPAWVFVVDPSSDDPATTLVVIAVAQGDCTDLARTAL